MVMTWLGGVQSSNHRSEGGSAAYVESEDAAEPLGFWPYSVASCSCKENRIK